MRTTLRQRCAAGGPAAAAPGRTRRGRRRRSGLRAARRCSAASSTMRAARGVDQEGGRLHRGRARSAPTMPRVRSAEDRWSVTKSARREQLVAWPTSVAPPLGGALRRSGSGSTRRPPCRTPGRPRATRAPRRPRPTTPSVLPSRSTPRSVCHAAGAHRARPRPGSLAQQREDQAPGRARRSAARRPPVPQTATPRSAAGGEVDRGVAHAGGDQQLQVAAGASSSSRRERRALAHRDHDVEGLQRPDELLPVGDVAVEDRELAPRRQAPPVGEAARDLLVVVQDRDPHHAVPPARCRSAPDAPAGRSPPPHPGPLASARSRKSSRSWPQNSSPR